MREARNVVRDKASMGARVGSTVFLNLIIGLVFQARAAQPDRTRARGRACLRNASA
jgi:hypothetical protein